MLGGQYGSLVDSVSLLTCRCLLKVKAPAQEGICFGQNHPPMKVLITPGEDMAERQINGAFRAYIKLLIQM